jgi:hypothetical protein
MLHLNLGKGIHYSNSSIVSQPTIQFFIAYVLRVSQINLQIFLLLSLVVRVNNLSWLLPFDKIFRYIYCSTYIYSEGYWDIQRFVDTCRLHLQDRRIFQARNQHEAGSSGLTREQRELCPTKYSFTEPQL